jgi:hypothetical protein
MKSLYVSEAFCVGSGIDQSPEAMKDMIIFADEIIKRSYSIVARDVATDQVVGVAISVIHVSYKNIFNG